MDISIPHPGSTEGASSTTSPLKNKLTPGLPLESNSACPAERRHLIYQREERAERRAAVPSARTRAVI